MDRKMRFQNEVILMILEFCFGKQISENKCV